MQKSGTPILFTPGSTPVSLVVSVNESLEMIFEEGLDNVYHRHTVISRAIKNSLQAMGLILLPEGDVDRSHSVTVFKVPDGEKCFSFDFVNYLMLFKIRTTGKYFSKKIST